MGGRGKANDVICLLDTLQPVASKRDHKEMIHTFYIIRFIVYFIIISMITAIHLHSANRVKTILSTIYPQAIMRQDLECIYRHTLDVSVILTEGCQH